MQINRLTSLFHDVVSNSRTRNAMRQRTIEAFHHMGCQFAFLKTTARPAFQSGSAVVFLIVRKTSSELERATPGKCINTSE